MEFDPKVTVVSDTEDDLDGLQEFMSSFKSSYRAPDFDKIGEYLRSKERRMKRELEAKMDAYFSAELEKKRKEEEKEVTQRLALQAELNECKRECERLKETITRVSENHRVMCDREKRGEERFARLLEESKGNEESIAHFRVRNWELENEKTLLEETWKKRFRELESKLLSTETHAGMLKRMKSDSGVRTIGLPDSSAAKESVKVEQVKEELDLGSTSRNSAETHHTASGAGSGCHTPLVGIPSLQGRGGGRPASKDCISISSDSDGECPKALGSSDSTEPGSKEERFRFLDPIVSQGKLKIKRKRLTDHTGANSSIPKRKQTSSSIQLAESLKRFKEKTKIAVYPFSSSSEDSSDSENDGSKDFEIDQIMATLRRNRKG